MGQQDFNQLILFNAGEVNNISPMETTFDNIQQNRSGPYLGGFIRIYFQRDNETGE
jgi:hypothetical protein